MSYATPEEVKQRKNRIAWDLLTLHPDHHDILTYISASGLTCSISFQQLLPIVVTFNHVGQEDSSATSTLEIYEEVYFLTESEVNYVRMLGRRLQIHALNNLVCTDLATQITLTV